MTLSIGDDVVRPAAGCTRLRYTQRAMTPPAQREQAKLGRVRRVLRVIWQVLCAAGGAAIIGVLAGAEFSSLWIGLAAAVPGAIVGWVFGKYVSPLYFFAGPVTSQP